VFVVEKTNGYLMGASFDANTYFKNPVTNALGLILANASENAIVAGATQLLQSAGWPDYLLIYNGYFLQCTLYVDSVQGLEWYIVVLIPASVDVDHLGTQSRSYYIVLAVAIITLVVTVIGFILVVYFRKSAIMKLNRPVLILVVLVGGVLLCIGALLMLGDNNNTNCALRPYFLYGSFTVFFVPMLLKSWLAHQLFNINPFTRNKVLLKTNFCILYISAFVVVDLLLICSTLYANGQSTNPVQKTVLTNVNAYGTVTYCGYYDNTAFYFTQVVYKGLLMTTACYLSFVTRNVSGTLSGSMPLLSIVYNVTASVIILCVIVINVSSVESVVVAEACVVCYMVFVGTCLLAFPPCFQLITVGDKVAAEEVMLEIQESTGQKTLNSSKRLRVGLFSRLRNNSSMAENNRASKHVRVKVSDYFEEIDNRKQSSKPPEKLVSILEQKCN